MVNLYLSNKGLPEKKYILSVLLTHYLGVEVYWKSIEEEYCILEMHNGNRIIFEDYFFFNDGKYSKKLLPTKVLKWNSIFGDVLILYGRDYVNVTAKEVVLGYDILASAYFMLSRWEEIFTGNNDKHKRFQSGSSISIKFDFLNRPIVNEYVDVIWNILKYLGYEGERKEWNYKVVPTHDVDLPKMWWNKWNFPKQIIGDIFKRKSISSVLDTIYLYLKSHISGKDPFDTFDQLMNMSESVGTKSYFFFMSGGTSTKDNYYSIDHPYIESLIKEIDSRGHKVGFHPSYNSYNNIEQFIKEKSKLESIAKRHITCGRQHFLRFSNPITWQIWERTGMIWDSTLAYADLVGFRCGVCLPYPVYDVNNRVKLKLIERPLIVMDGSLVTYRNQSVEESIIRIQVLKNQVKKHNGEFVFLWHNSAFNTRLWRKKISLLSALYEN